ncbi:hypothetical protein [Burkholderia sp. ABCPW 11]|uniref:hypothetical protein n=1 Tax=Burkholderia sp. ABCPW 11 TaxID=1637859 RepID=UPI0012FDB78C|nr:hypothetical protein [Burkholderia sp. ABCPW 11]
MDSLFRYAADHDRHRKMLRRRLQYRDSSQRNATKTTAWNIQTSHYARSLPKNVGPSNLDNVIGEFAQADADGAQHAVAAARKTFAS